jgi:hypothetical protein
MTIEVCSQTGGGVFLSKYGPPTTACLTTNRLSRYIESSRRYVNILYDSLCWRIVLSKVAVCQFKSGKLKYRDRNKMTRVYDRENSLWRQNQTHAER